MFLYKILYLSRNIELMILYKILENYYQVMQIFREKLLKIRYIIQLRLPRIQFLIIYAFSKS